MFQIDNKKLNFGRKYLDLLLFSCIFIQIDINKRSGRMKKKRLFFYYVRGLFLFFVLKLHAGAIWDEGMRGWVSKNQSPDAKKLFKALSDNTLYQQIYASCSPTKKSFSNTRDIVSIFDDLSATRGHVFCSAHRMAKKNSNTYCFINELLEYKPFSFILGAIGFFGASIKTKQKNPFVAKTCLILSVASIAGSLGKSLWDLADSSFNIKKIKK